MRTLPNVIMTPHVASNTVEVNQPMAMRALQNNMLAERGEFDKMDFLNLKRKRGRFLPLTKGEI